MIVMCRNRVVVVSGFLVNLVVEEITSVDKLHVLVQLRLMSLVVCVLSSVVMKHHLKQ